MPDLSFSLNANLFQKNNPLLVRFLSLDLFIYNEFCRLAGHTIVITIMNYKNQTKYIFLVLNLFSYKHLNSYLPNRNYNPTFNELRMQY